MMFLEGVRVLDLSRVLAGPFAAQNLGDMGAEVLKIESPSGDDTRHWGPPFQGEMAAYFQSCNRNKASLVLNLKDAEQYRYLLDLAAKADVIIDNFPPAVRARLNLEDAIFHQQNPKLVVMNITGYSGKRSQEPGYDVMIQAESGLMGITGEPEGEPHKMGVAVCDVLTGMMAANGILAALYRAAKTGEGASLSLSLYRTALLSLVNVATNHLVSGKPSRRWGNAHPNLMPYEPFRLADRTILLGTGNDKQFKRLCDLLQISDPNLRNLDNAARLERRQEISDILNQKLRHQKTQELLPLLKQNGIPAAPILRPDEAIAGIRQWDPGALLALDHATMGTIELINNPIVSEGMRQSHTPPPELGESGEAMARMWLAG